MVGDKVLILRSYYFIERILKIAYRNPFSIRLFLLLTIAVICGSFINIRPSLKAWRLNGYAQGTTYHITYYAADSTVTVKEIDNILNKIDSSLSLYKPYSLINQFNNSVAGITIDQHFKRVIKKSLEVFHQTEGAFDITVKPLVQIWGFGVKPVTEWPDSVQIKAILKSIGSNKLHIDKEQLIKDNPAVQIDVNGIAQGYSVDVLANFLEKNHILNYLVELGGEIRIKGRKQPSDEMMRIGIESPNETDFGQSPMQRIVKLDKGAITTSGNYRKFRQAGSKKISHLINPKSGYPINNELISVTVYAKDAITADGYDNALMGMGLEKAFLFLKNRKKIEAYFIYHKPDGSIADTATNHFPKFIKQ